MPLENCLGSVFFNFLVPFFACLPADSYPRVSATRNGERSCAETSFRPGQVKTKLT